VYQFVGLMWLVEYNAERAAKPDCPMTLNSMNTLLSAYAALEALVLESAYVLHPALYSGRRYRHEDLVAKYRKFLKADGRDEMPLAIIGELVSARIAMTHSEPDHERSRYLGQWLNARHAAKFSAGVREVASWLWAGRRPVPLANEFDNPNPFLAALP
jgi:hypothetical protein